MAFNAVKARKDSSDKQAKAKQDSKNKITAILPISGVTADGFLELRNDSNVYYADVFKPKKYDLNRLTLPEANMIEEQSWDFMRQYQKSVKEIFLNFPENNKEQQKYFRHMIEVTRDPFRLKMLEKELYKMQFLERNYQKLSSWIMIFGQSEIELQHNIESIKKFSGIYGFTDTTVDEKQTMFFLMNNPGVIDNNEDE